jgi:hypothetical protein
MVCAGLDTALRCLLYRDEVPSSEWILFSHKSGLLARVKLHSIYGICRLYYNLSNVTNWGVAWRHVPGRVMWIVYNDLDSDWLPDFFTKNTLALVQASSSLRTWSSFLSGCWSLIWSGLLPSLFFPVCQTPGTDSLLCCFLHITPGRSNRNAGLPTVRCHATQQCRAGERIDGSVQLAVP